MSKSCKVRNKEFPSGKSWGGHIRACYKKEEDEKDREGTEDWRVHECSSSESESESEFEFRVDVDESGTKGSMEPVDLREYLPRAKKGIREELAKYQDRFAHQLALNKKPMKSIAYTQEKRPSEFKVGHKRTYVCRECGLVFDSFQGLGGHLAAHNRKREREKEGKLDLVSRVHQDSRGKSVIIGDAPRKEYKCNLCERSFPSGQALGGHMSYHGPAHKVYKHEDSHHTTADTENKNSASSYEASKGADSHPNPPSSVQVSHLDPQPGSALDLNMAPDEDVWGNGVGVQKKSQLS
ncbi:zinc finger protein ZAT9-like [Populus alba x Populus x berolinensis]|uniref:Zinc finger protein ZAT9-like n=1 Tax=Populus alba x Populus x berolinensis TaxID=444605 RepID=A0AAD6Q613_9ROSI|nr:zinc finger protein ZAT9-like [Populus alba x Populus x berolinensis]